jgi:hypothetical protein
MTQLLLQAGPGTPPSEFGGGRIGVPGLRPSLKRTMWQSRCNADASYFLSLISIVVFGGFQRMGSVDLQDTWEFDKATGWVLRQPTTTPSARSGCAATFHSGNGSTMVFGGLANGQYQGDLWQWDGGTNWKRLASGGPARADAAMSYDAASDVLVLVGGRDANGFLGDVCVWNQAQGWFSPNLT